MTAPSTHAFPSIEGPGMTLREWYAGQALAIVVPDAAMFDVCSSAAKKNGIKITDHIAKCAVQIADAMIAALKESGDG